MATEIERKFLVKNDHWRSAVYRSTRLRQGYLISDRTRSVRVRVSDEQAHLNIKSATLGVSRSEYEYAIPLADAIEMLEQLCQKPLLEKTRHLVRHGDHVWEIDEFEGDNAGLIVAEVELDAADTVPDLPDWAGTEVSHDARYYNSELAKHPYTTWHGPSRAADCEESS